MALQFSTTARNNMLDSIETTIGTSPILKIFSGAPPANCAAASTGTVIATITCPSDFMASASGGSKVLAGTWQDASADNDGRPGHYRLFDSAGTVCHVQGRAGVPWKASTAFAVGDCVTNDGGKAYVCTTAGTSASSGGPTGTTASITDGSVTWTYFAAAPDMTFNATDITHDQPIPIDAFTLNIGGA